MDLKSFWLLCEIAKKGICHDRRMEKQKQGCEMKDKKKPKKTIPRPTTVARAFAKHGYPIQTIAGHYGIGLGTVEYLLAKYINKISGWDKP